MHVSLDSFSFSDSINSDWDNPVHGSGDECSESIGDMVVGSGNKTWNENENKVEETIRRWVTRDDGYIDPNNNMPDIPPHIDVDGRITFELYQVFDDHKHFLCY